MGWMGGCGWNGRGWQILPGPMSYFPVQKKTSLFVKSPQEQNVPLQLECASCLHVPSSVCVCVFVFVCLLEPFQLAGWLSNRCFGCHWLAWLVINRAWLHAGMNRKGLTKDRSQFSCLHRSNETRHFLKMSSCRNNAFALGFLSVPTAPFSLLFGCHHSSVCENEKWNMCAFCGTGVIRQSRSLRL